MAENGAKIDVLMCCGPVDVDYLFPFSLRCCLKQFAPLDRLTIVTPDKERVIDVVSSLGLSADSRIRILHDDDVLPAPLREWPGWYRQQFIKLMADEICGTPFVACIGSDTVMLAPVTNHDLFDGEEPYLFFNRYPTPSPHLAYERRRVENVARLLRVEPRRSLPLGDFVMDFAIFPAERLAGLRRYVEAIYGERGIAAVVPRECDTLEQKAAFGEWSLHAVYVLDVLNMPVPLRNSCNQFVTQIHSRSDYASYRFDSRVVHFVSKSFDIGDIRAKLAQLGAL